MKTFLARAASFTVTTLLALAFVSPALGQAEKVKEKAKDLKKKVEGQTNSPPQKTPPPPQKPAK